MTAPRANHSATLLPDGNALIIGGSSWTGWGTGTLYYSCCLSSAELYDPVTGLFASTGSMTAGRAGHTVTLLGNGNVLIAGGNGDAGVPATAELYHPVTPIPRARVALAFGRRARPGRDPARRDHADRLGRRSRGCRRVSVHLPHRSG